MTTQTLLISTRNPEINHRTGLLCVDKTSYKRRLIALIDYADGLHLQCERIRADARALTLELPHNSDALPPLLDIVASWFDCFSPPGYVFDCYFVQGVPCWGWWPREG